MDVKKVLLPFVAALLLSLSALAQSTPHYVYIPQYHHVPSASSAPWDGHSLISLQMGSGFYSKPTFAVEPESYNPHLPFVASLRYAGEKNFSGSFFWGWNSDLSFTRLQYDYTYDGDVYQITSRNGVSSLGCDLVNKVSSWTLFLDESLSLGLNITRRLDAAVAAGVGMSFLSGGSYTTDYVNRASATTLDVEKINPNSGIFDFFSFCVLLRGKVRYFFSDNFFLSVEGQARFTSHSSDYESPRTLNQYCFLLGVGYKAFKKKSVLDD